MGRLLGQAFAVLAGVGFAVLMLALFLGWVSQWAWLVVILGASLLTYVGTKVFGD